MTAALSFETVTNQCPISSTDELKSFRNGRKPELRILDVTAQVVSIGNPNANGYRPLTIEDANGRSELIYRGDDLSQGDVARFRGISRLNARLMPWDEPVEATIIENRELPDPLVTTIDRIDARRDDLKTITTEGVVVSSFVDELDPRFWILIVKGARSTLPVYVLREELPADGVDTDAQITVTGVFHRTINSWRQFQHPAVIADSVRVLRPPRADPFDVPEMDNVATLTIEEIAGLGRRRIDGRILATWDGDRLMLKDRADRIYFARLQPGTEPPQVDDSVTLVGETDASIFNLTFENAIWKPSAPNLKDVKLSVRFRLARNTLSDNTAYAILRIIRELAVNAKRHGNASEIRVAGSVEEQRILFSVQDNGTGFDPERIPGVDEGHFGLQGIRERIRHLNGEMKIESSPNHGTKVSIWIKKPQC